MTRLDSDCLSAAHGRLPDRPAAAGGLSAGRFRAQPGRCGGQQALLPVKTALYFWLAARFRLCACSATPTALHLASYSEFVPVAGTITIRHGWPGSDWLVLIAIALSGSFVLPAPLNSKADLLSARERKLPVTIP